MTPYRAAIIGLGFVGAGDQVSGDALGQQVADLDGTHVEALGGHSRIELVAGSSRDPGRRERFARRTQAATYTDWREMLARERPDIVSVATYAAVHAEMTLGCAESGVRAVWCEKPIATRLPDAERMVAACCASGTLLAINHNRRYQPTYHRLQEFIAAGHLGDLTSVSLEWGTGRLSNVGTHMIDAAWMLTGRQVRAVSGTLDLAGRPDCRGPACRDPGGWGHLRFDGGLIATIDAGDYSQALARIAINGTLGRATTGDRDVRIEFWGGRSDHWSDPGPRPTSMDRALAQIVASLDDATPFPYAAEEAVATLEVIIAFHASHARGSAWTDLPLIGPDREIEVHSG
jgi:UDP-N-acetylglucosamine 3-dehydrogenase